VDQQLKQLMKELGEAINESLANQGAPAFVDTTAPINTGGIVIGRDDTQLKGWVTTNGNQWQFEGNVAGKPERFDFNRDPKRGFLRDTGAGIVGPIGHALGAADYDANYTGDVVVKASGKIRK